MRAKDGLRVRGKLRVLHIPGECFHGKDPCQPLDPATTRDLCKRGIVRERTYGNLVVDSGRSIVSRLIGFGRNFPSVGGQGVTDVNDLAFSFMRLGSTANPTAPIAANTDISEDPPTYQINALTVYYPSATMVSIAGVVPQALSALDGTAFTEEGLFVVNTAMLAHVTFSPEVKIPTHAIQFEHSFSVL